MWITVRRAVLALSIIFVASSQADTFVWIGDGFTTNWNSFSTPSVLDPGGYENWELNSQTPQFLPGADDSVLIRDVHDSGIIDLNGNRRVSELRISTTQFFQMRDDTLTLDAGNITRSDTGGVEANHLISSNVTLGKAGVLNMNGTGFLRIGGVLTAPAGFSKTGPAELVLSNTGNQIGGPVLIQRGKLRISPFLSGYVIDHDIVFQPSPGLTAFLETTASMNVTGAIRSDGSAYFQADLNVASGTTLNVLGGVGAGRLSLTGNGTLRTTSVTSDELRVRSGTLQLDGTVGSGTELYLSGGAIRANTALQTAGTLRIEDELGIFDTGPHRVSFASIAPGPILAADQFLVKRGSGTLAGSSQNTFVNVKIESGVFETDTPSNFNRLILEGGTFRPLVSTPSGSRATMQMGPGDGAIETPNDLTLGVSLSGSHRLSKRGLGSLRLTGFADNFTGLLAVEHGNLTLDLQGKLGSSAVSVSPGARLTLGGPFQLKRQTAVLVDGELEIPNGAIIDYLLLNGAAQTTGSAALSLPPGSNVVVSDPGSTTAINNRILTNAFGDPGQTVSFHVIPTDARLDLLNGVSSLTLFRKTGRGTLGLYGDGEFFPGLQIEDGTVEVGSTQAVFSEGDYMANDGLLRLGGGRLKLMGNNIRLPGVQLLADGGTIDLNGNDARIDEFNISGPGTLTVTGGGVLTLKTANSLPGGLVIDNATLVPDNPFALAGGSRVTMKGGTIRTTSATTSLPGLDIIPMTAFDLNILELDGAQVTPNGNISGKGRLYVGGQGAINFFGFAQDHAHPRFAPALGATLRNDPHGPPGPFPPSPQPAQLPITRRTVDPAGEFTNHATRGNHIGPVSPSHWEQPCGSTATATWACCPCLPNPPNCRSTAVRWTPPEISQSTPTEESRSARSAQRSLSPAAEPSPSMARSAARRHSRSADSQRPGPARCCSTGTTPTSERPSSSKEPWPSDRPWPPAAMKSSSNWPRCLMPPPCPPAAQRACPTR